MRIRINDDPILREVCKPIDKVTPDIFRLSSQMYNFMVSKDAIGLAANQVGHSIRLVTINTEKADPAHGCQLTLINPEIIEQGDPGTSTPEGCLSLPDELVIVPRAMKIKVKYLNVFGKATVRDFVNITAVCIQHEIDHLNGILMTDYKKMTKDKAQADKASPQPV